jgi:peroxiredoxin
MTATRTARPQTASTEIPPVPLTIEGYSVLHQMFRFRWNDWRPLRPTQKAEIADEAAEVLKKCEESTSGQSSLYSVLGHKGDLMLVHFRESFDDLNRAEMQFSHLRLADYLEPATSYLSVIELGLYESSVKTYRELAEQGIEQHSEEWKQAITETLARQREAMRPRLFPEIPKNRYVCFYPMDRRRGEDKNWYTLPIEVKQIITGSIGFDDWEWGVDLFADDPLVFKKLIYEMRFDEVSAVYALFGTFYLGVRCSWCSLGKLLNGEVPE